MTRARTRAGRVRLLVVLGVALLAGCASPIPSASPTAPPSPSGSAATPSVAPPPPTASPTPSAPSVQLQIFGRRLEHCGSIGGCGVHGSIGSVGLPDAREVALEVLAKEFEVVAGLPRAIPAGPATIRFRTTFVSDDVANGQPPEETTETTCEARFESSGNSTVRVELTIRRGACTVEVFYVVSIID